MAAKKTSSVTYTSVLSDLKARHYAPVYLLKGDEPYYIDTIADYVATHVLDEVEQDFNQQVVYGADYSAAQIADMARQLPMMAENRVVVVREAQNIKNWEPLANYLDHPSDATLLVLCCKDKGSSTGEKKTGWLRFLKLAKEKGVYLDCKKRYEKDLPPFITAYLKERNVGIDAAATQLVADHLGADLTRIASELDKVIANLAPDNRHITLQTVADSIGVSREYNVFELKKAVIKRDVLQANKIWKFFENNDAPRYYNIIIATLFPYFETLFIAHFAPNKNDLQQYLGLRERWQTYDYIDGLRAFNAKKTLGIIHRLHEAAAKGNGIDNRSASYGELMRELLFFIMH